MNRFDASFGLLRKVDLRWNCYLVSISGTYGALYLGACHNYLFMTNDFIMKSNSYIMFPCIAMLSYTWYNKNIMNHGITSFMGGINCIRVLVYIHVFISSYVCFCIWSYVHVFISQWGDGGIAMPIIDRSCNFGKNKVITNW